MGPSWDDCRLLAFDMVELGSFLVHAMSKIVFFYLKVYCRYYIFCFLQALFAYSTQINQIVLAKSRTPEHTTLISTRYMLTVFHNSRLSRDQLWDGSWWVRQQPMPEQRYLPGRHKPLRLHVSRGWVHVHVNSDWSEINFFFSYRLDSMKTLRALFHDISLIRDVSGFFLLKLFRQNSGLFISLQKWLDSWQRRTHIFIRNFLIKDRT